MTENEELRSIGRQLENKREHLLLIQERKSQYVLDTDVPLELIKEERETESEIADLEARLTALKVRAPVRSTVPSAQIKKPIVWAVGCAVTLLLGVVLSIALVTRLLRPKDELSSPTSAPLAAISTEVVSVDRQTPQPGANRPTSIGSTPTPAPGGGLALVPPTFTPTPTLLAAMNLTNNREGGYDKIDLAYDQAGKLHLVFLSKLLRSKGDYFYSQLPPGGDWSAPQRLTEGFDYLWSKMFIEQSPEGTICVLWSGISSIGDGAYRRCLTGPDGEFSPAEIWRTKQNGYRSSFVPMLLPGGEVAAIFGDPGHIFFQDKLIQEYVPSVWSVKFVRDTAGVYHLIWFRQGNPYSLEYMSSSDGGITWENQQRLTGEDDKPAIWFDLKADSSGGLHLVWIGDGIFYRKWSLTTGWGSSKKILNARCMPKIDVNSTGLARVASVCANDLYYIEQSANGNWSWPDRVANMGNSMVDGVDIAVDKDDRVTILWVAKQDIQTVSLQGGNKVP